jgi:hypothetical protein
MKQIVILCMMLTALGSSATMADSTFQRHQISVSLANAMSQTFFDDPGHKPVTVVNYGSYGPFYSSGIHASYLPLYAMHLQLHYSLGITPMIRIETGLGYLFSGSVVNQDYTTTGEFYFIKGSYTAYTFTGNITLPLYLKLTKPTPRGAFTCTFGPDFTMPVHQVYRQTNVIENNVAKSNVTGQSMFQTSATAANATMGLYLKLGYEKKIKQNMSINVGPALDFYHLVAFHNDNTNYANTGYHPYQYYIGLDVAINFGFHLTTKSGRF